MSYAARALTKAKATKEPGDLNQTELVKMVADDMNYEVSDVGAVVSSALNVIQQTVANGNKVALAGMKV